jgi:hypothetical protein
MTVEEQIDFGGRAERAYHSYFKAYFESRYEGLYEKFKSDEAEELLAIKAELRAIQVVERDLLNAIDTGRLARIQTQDTL